MVDYALPYKRIIMVSLGAFTKFKPISDHFYLTFIVSHVNEIRFKLSNMRIIFNLLHDLIIWFGKKRIRGWMDRINSFKIDNHMHVE